MTDIIEYAYCDLRDKVFALQEIMLSMPQVELPLNHYFAGNLYARELIIPKDTTIVGKIHKYDHFVMVIKGELSFSADDYSVKRVKAPFIMRSKAGAKRAIYAHEDSVMVTVHLYCESPEFADAQLVFETEQEWLEFNARLPQSAQLSQSVQLVLPLEAVRG